jgi:hypothetical protein
MDKPAWELVEECSDSLPFLLLPVRIETRFMSVGDHKELWVRIFPDDIAVHTHEPSLTLDEVNTGKIYWREVWLARHANDQAMEKGAWRALAQAYGGTRAAWVARQMTPVTLDVPNADALQFPQFSDEMLKAESWSQSPRSKVMPDRFVVMGFFQGKEVLRQAGEPIPNPLILGADPQKADGGFRQENGELFADEEIAWLYDFQQAVKIGMGLQIALEPPFDTRGLDRLLVLGLRLSGDADAAQALVEELFENHSYAEDGLSFVSQGTPTNNTDRQGSGYSSDDPGAELSFGVQTGDPLFEPVDDPLEKRDAQRLVEALGIQHELFQRIQHADSNDARDALHVNRALWNATLGYYLDDMLDRDAARITAIRSFFIDHVTARGQLPAIRVGSQPYGILLTSDFARWQWSPDVDGAELSVLNEMLNVMRALDRIWRTLLPKVARIGASGDPSQDLLNTLALQPTSVEFYRRHAVGKEYLSNYEAFNPGAFRGRSVVDMLNERARVLANEIAIGEAVLPPIYNLSFFDRQDLIADPLVDDIAADETEKLSETKQLRSVYQIPDPITPDARLTTNYIGWLALSGYRSLKAQRFLNAAGESLPMPRPLLYRLLRASLLETLYDAAIRLYMHFHRVPRSIRREVELTNIQTSRTITRWEFMDANVSTVLPFTTQTDQTVGEFLLSEVGLNLADADVLRETLAAIRALINLPTARLERAFVEHLDLCSYRLDAWQMGCFHRRLQQLRYPRQSEGAFARRTQGLYLGAFGWLENLRPNAALTPADFTLVPAALHNPAHDGALFEQTDNAGFIHTPSLNQATAAAVLRSAYLTHFDSAHPEKMAVNLSSERVRTALTFLEGVRNGQSLGTLLGYQFERGLHDRYGDPSLNQYISFFRQAYPLVADKITQDAAGEQIESKEARNVFDGYALMEAAFLREPGLPYPYGVNGLPPMFTHNPTLRAHVQAIQAEVARMAETLDGIADLALAEGLYQVVQGNYDRAGAMLSAMTQGNTPPDPEVVRTPRSGTPITQRIALHLQPGSVGSTWGANARSRRADVEPGLNRWLGDMLPRPNRIRFIVRLNGGNPVEQDISLLRMQPIDLIYLIGDDVNGETTELETRIAFENRRRAQNDALDVSNEWMTPPTSAQAVSLFELLPLLRVLRQIVTNSRPLAASDFRLPSETQSDSGAGVDFGDLKARVESIVTAFAAAVDALRSITPLSANGQPLVQQVNAERLRTALRELALFGVPDAFPLSAFGNAPEAKQALTQQAVNILAIASRQLTSARGFMAGDDTTLNPQDRAARYREAAQAIFGQSFNLLPRFTLTNPNDVQAGVAFRDALPDTNLMRHHRDNPLIVDEWLQGVARVQPRVAVLEMTGILSETFGAPPLASKPLQLPFRASDFWIAVEYPETFVPEGEFLSILQILPAPTFQANALQTGLLVDEWVEVIPSQSETTGIAFHFNQPNTEPPQTLLLAVTPEITGKWSWDKLVGILNDTLDRAQLRAVEPEHLGDTALGQLLPAILTPVASHRFATISTDLVYQTAVLIENAQDEG